MLIYKTTFSASGLSRFITAKLGSTDYDNLLGLRVACESIRFSFAAKSEGETDAFAG